MKLLTVVKSDLARAGLAALSFLCFVLSLLAVPFGFVEKVLSYPSYLLIRARRERDADMIREMLGVDIDQDNVQLLVTKKKPNDVVPPMEN